MPKASACHSSIGIPIAVDVGTTSTLVWAGEIENAKGASVVNSSTQPIYFALGQPATTTSFTRVLAPGDYWEMPASYVGQLYAVVAYGTASCVVTTYRPPGFTGAA